MARAEKKKEVYSGKIVEISERYDDIEFKPFYLVVLRIEERPDISFAKRIDFCEEG